MTIEQNIAELVQASNNLTGVVDGKMKEIDKKVKQTQDSLNSWKDSVQAKDINGQALYKSEIDLTGLSSDRYYPVWWQFPNNSAGASFINIVRNYSENRSDEPFGEGVTHLAGLELYIEGIDCRWGGGAQSFVIKRIGQTYRKTVRKAGHGISCIARPVSGNLPLYAAVTDGSVVRCKMFSGCYLRGGLTYHVMSSMSNAPKYSREDSEVSIYSSVASTWEINWKVKSYHKDDEFLGPEYPECRLPYSYHYNKLFAPKNA